MEKAEKSSMESQRAMGAIASSAASISARKADKARQLLDPVEAAAASASAAEENVTFASCQRKAVQAEEDDAADCRVEVAQAKLAAAIADWTEFRAYLNKLPDKGVQRQIEGLPTATESRIAIDLSTVLGYLRNQILFHRQRNPLLLSVPIAVATPNAIVRTCSSAVRQPRARPWSAMSRKSNSSGSTTPV
eukprot:162312-Pleurochrysis_carterae.AAC.1